VKGENMVDGVGVSSEQTNIETALRLASQVGQDVVERKKKGRPDPLVVIHLKPAGRAADYDHLVARAEEAFRGARELIVTNPDICSRYPQASVGLLYMRDRPPEYTQGP
jgi:hypothetical protein